MSTQPCSCVSYLKLAVVVVLATRIVNLDMTYSKLPAFGNQKPWPFLQAPFSSSPSLPLSLFTGYKNLFAISLKFIHLILQSHCTHLTLIGYNSERKQKWKQNIFTIKELISKFKIRNLKRHRSLARKTNILKG